MWLVSMAEWWAAVALAEQLGLSLAAMAAAHHLFGSIVFSHERLEMGLSDINKLTVRVP